MLSNSVPIYGLQSVLENNVERIEVIQSLLNAIYVLYSV